MNKQQITVNSSPMINFDTNLSQIFCSCYLALAKQKQLHKQLSAVEYPTPLYWFATSGSTAQKHKQRWVGLSKAALMASAAAVNSHLASNKNDVWLSPLPIFHVGGAGIYARAYLSGASVYTIDKWQPEEYCAKLNAYQATLTALVPAHVYDIVKCKLTPPAALRAAIVGGGKLPKDLYEQAVALAWPLLPSYGMTECASQIATATLGSWHTGVEPPMYLLPHISARTDQEGRLQVSSPALLSVYALVSEAQVQLQEPLIDGWLTTEDKVVLSQQTLRMLGRAADWIKIGGENVNLALLQEIWETACRQLGLEAQTALFAQQDARLGYVIAAAITPILSPHLSELQAIYHQQTMRYEQIRAVYTVPTIPRTSLGKVARQLLLDALKDSNV